MNTNRHRGSWATCLLCDERITALEANGLTTSDAQGVAMAEHMEAKPRSKHASRAEQRGRYIDCGPQAWDDRDGGP